MAAASSSGLADLNSSANPQILDNSDEIFDNDFDPRRRSTTEDNTAAAAGGGGVQANGIRDMGELFHTFSILPR